VVNPKPFLIGGLIVAGGGIAIGLLGWGLSRGMDPARPPTDVERYFAIDEGWEGVQFPDFSLIDQDGRSVDQTTLDDRITIVDFIFTNCPLQCPAMTGALWALSEDLKDTRVQFLSLSIDPERDTPERLREYAGQYGIDTQRWRFLTGDKEAIRGIVRNALMFEVSDNPDSKVTLADGSTMDNIIHPPHFILIGPSRQVMGITFYQDQTQVDRLKARARALAEALPHR
jgi:protein SCO1